MFTGAWAEGAKAAMNAAAWGSLIGSVDLTNFIQDKLIDLAMKFTCSSMYYFVKESHTI